MLCCTFTARNVSSVIFCSVGESTDHLHNFCCVKKETGSLIPLLLMKVIRDLSHIHWAKWVYALKCNTYHDTEKDNCKIHCSCVLCLIQIEVEKDLVLFMIQGQGVDEEPTQVLEINSYTSEIKVLRSVDYEQYKTLKVRRNFKKISKWKVKAMHGVRFDYFVFPLQLKFKALDREKHELETHLGIYIEILDTNDNPPKFLFEKYTFTIKESTSQGNFLIWKEILFKLLMLWCQNYVFVTVNLNNIIIISFWY